MLFQSGKLPSNGFQLPLNIQLFPYHGFEFFIKPRHIHDVVGLQEIQHFCCVFEVIEGLGMEYPVFPVCAADIPLPFLLSALPHQEQVRPLTHPLLFSFSHVSPHSRFHSLTLCNNIFNLLVLDYWTLFCLFSHFPAFQSKDHIPGTLKITHILFPAYVAFAVLQTDELLFHLPSAVRAYLSPHNARK